MRETTERASRALGKQGELCNTPWGVALGIKTHTSMSGCQNSSMAVGFLREIRGEWGQRCSGLSQLHRYGGNTRTARPAHSKGPSASIPSSCDGQQEKWRKESKDRAQETFLIRGPLPCLQPACWYPRPYAPLTQLQLGHGALKTGSQDLYLSLNAGRARVQGAGETARK